MSCTKPAILTLFSAIIFMAIFGSLGLLPRQAFSGFGLFTIFIYILTNVLVIRN